MKKFDLNKLKSDYAGILLDIGCGGRKHNEKFVGIDKRDLPNVDIVHDLETFPYPLPDESCLTIIGSHIVEHIKPWLTFDLMNELWRIMMPNGQLALSTPYAGSSEYFQDPTHVNPFNQVTFQYFDPRYPLYNEYRPKPWRIAIGFPVWQTTGNLEAVMSKMSLEECEKILEGIWGKAEEKERVELTQVKGIANV